MNGDVYRGFWRWHFYGGLIALPFLAWLAITGGLYLFKPEIEDAVYGDWITLPAPRAALPPSRLIESVERQIKGSVTQIEVPASASQSWRMRVDVGDEPRTAFVDPGTGAVLGSTQAGGIMKTVRDLHSLAITGTIGNALIEIAAGWAIILVVTGIALWWPRSGKPALALRGPPAKRRFWRDLHASTGAVAGAIILFLGLTGMPWSVFWGSNLQRIVAEHGLGRPPAPGLRQREAGQHHGGPRHGRDTASAQRETLPWALQRQDMPPASHGSDIGVDRAILIAQSRGVGAPMAINLPLEHGQPYSLSRKAAQAQDAHVTYIDPAGGKVLYDMSFAQFGRGAQVIEWGVATHQGDQYGEANRWVMLGGCVSLLILCISAPILWWKRRPGGRLQLPPVPQHGRRALPALVIAAAIGAVFPLTGSSLICMLVFDRALAATLASRAGVVPVKANRQESRITARPA